jgi:hypothetical protein
MVKLIEAVSQGVPAVLTEIRTLGRTLKKRATDIPAYFDRPCTSNGPTEAMCEARTPPRLGVRLPQPHQLRRRIAPRDHCHRASTHLPEDPRVRSQANERRQVTQRHHAVLETRNRPRDIPPADNPSCIHRPRPAAPVAGSIRLHTHPSRSHHGVQYRQALLRREKPPQRSRVPQRLPGPPRAADNSSIRCLTKIGASLNYDEPL